MKNNFCIIVFLFLTFSALGQNRYKRISIYANGGTQLISNFDFKPSYSAFGQLGVKCRLFGGFSAGLDFNNLYLRKLSNREDILSSYQAQSTGIDIMTIYEKEVRRDWFLGFGVSLNLAVLKGSATINGIIKGLNAKNPGNYNDGIVYNYKYFGNIRRVINKKIDLQAGVCFNDYQSYYLDLFYNKNEKLDRFVTAYVGVVYKFTKQGYSNNNKSRSGILIRCPKVNFNRKRK